MVVSSSLPVEPATPADAAAVVALREAVTAWLRAVGWQDPLVWGEQPPDAGYVHGLLVDRSCAGRGLGRALIGWASRRTLAAGRSILRLDCVATNPWLRGYYADLGFTEVGYREYESVAMRPSVLLEKRLRQVASVSRCR